MTGANNANRVDVTFAVPAVAVRDSKNRGGGALTFGHES
jgi:hypothetical protein